MSRLISKGTRVRYSGVVGSLNGKIGTVTGFKDGWTLVDFGEGPVKCADCFLTPVKEIDAWWLTEVGIKRHFGEQMEQEAQRHREATQRINDEELAALAAHAEHIGAKA